MTKDKQEKKDITNIDLRTFLTDTVDTNKLDFQKSVSLGILYSLGKFHESSKTNKYDSKIMAILMEVNPTMRTLCENVIRLRKDEKRIKENKWLKIITALASYSNIENDSEKSGMFSFLKR